MDAGGPATEPSGPADKSSRADGSVSRVEFEQMLLARHGLSVRGRASSAYVVLSRIELDGLLSVGQLSEAFGLDVSTLNRQTATMLKRGLVERVPDPDGGMARKFRMTAKGKSRLAAFRAANVASLEKVMAGWPQADVTAFADLLYRFNRGIEQLEGRDWPRPDDGSPLGEAPGLPER